MAAKTLVTLALAAGLPLAPPALQHPPPPLRVTRPPTHLKAARSLQAFDRLRGLRYKMALALLFSEGSHPLLGQTQGEVTTLGSLQARSFTEGFMVVNHSPQDQEVTKAQLGLSECGAYFTVGAEDAVFLQGLGPPPTYDYF